MAQQLPKSEIKARNEEESLREMLPFAIYALVPLLITITIAVTIGTNY